MGTARTVKRCEIPGADRRRPYKFEPAGTFRAICSRAGLTRWHGPHQVAHKSTSTGTEAFSTTSEIMIAGRGIHGSHWWQLPQRGFTVGATGTRLRLPQCEHMTVVIFIRAASGRRAR